MNIGALSLGIGFGWSSPVQSQLQFQDDGSCTHKFCVSNSEFAWIVSFMAIGAATMSSFAGQLMKRIGRKFSLFVYIVPVLLGWICIAWAENTTWIYIGRLLVGCSGGAVTVIIPVYVAEISQPDIRGRLSSYFTIMTNLGTVYAYVSGYFFDMFWMNVACGAVAVVNFLGLFLVPESPRFDVSRTRLSKAKESLRFLRGKRYDVDTEVQTILEAQEELEKQESGNAYKDLFVDAVNRKAFIIVIGVIFAFQMSGINAILFYTDPILRVSYF